MNKIDTKIKVKKEVKTEKNVELKDKLKSAHVELNKLRLDHNMGKLKNTKALTIKRKEIARMLTAMQALKF